MPRSLARAATLGVVALTLVGVTAAPALAHVTVHPDSAVQGGYAKLTFRVPTERDDASTTKLEVHFPTDRPIPSVSVQPHPGWSYKVDKDKPAEPLTSHGEQVTQVVSVITWTADSPETAIKPGEFDEFAVSAGPLPKASELTFPALQTYSDGEVVKWIETAPAGQPEPEHPAPAVRLTPAGSTTNAAATANAAASNATGSGTDGSGTGRTLAIAALVVAVLAAAVTGMSALRARAR